MEHLLPKPDYKAPSPWTDWPFWKFGLEKEALFEVLHPKFNTMPIAIQEPTAFLLDVCDISNKADTRDQLFALLGQRRELRLGETYAAWTETSQTIAGQPTLIASSTQPQDKRWAKFLHLASNFSFDSIVQYFSTTRRDAAMPELQSPTSPLHPPSQQPETAVTAAAETRTTRSNHLPSPSTLLPTSKAGGAQTAARTRRSPNLGSRDSRPSKPSSRTRPQRERCRSLRRSARLRARTSFAGGRVLNIALERKA